MAKALRGEVDEDDDDETAGEDEFDLFAPIDLGVDEDGEEDLDNAGESTLRQVVEWLLTLT